MARLDKEKQKKIEPKRMEYAKTEIQKLGYTIVYEDENELMFQFKGKTISFYPYSGWHTGATIKDGRGIEKLLKQLR